MIWDFKHIPIDFGSDLQFLKKVNLCFFFNFTLQLRACLAKSLGSSNFAGQNKQYETMA